MRCGFRILPTGKVAASRPTMAKTASVAAAAIDPGDTATGAICAAAPPRPNNTAATAMTATSGITLSTVVNSWTSPALRAPRMLTRVKIQDRGDGDGWGNNRLAERRHQAAERAYRRDRERRYGGPDGNPVAPHDGEGRSLAACRPHISVRTASILAASRQSPRRGTGATPIVSSQP